MYIKVVCEIFVVYIASNVIKSEVIKTPHSIAALRIISVLLIQTFEDDFAKNHRRVIMAKKNLFVGMLAIALTFAFVVAGCKNNEENNPVEKSITITGLPETATTYSVILATGSSENEIVAYGTTLATEVSGDHTFDLNVYNASGTTDAEKYTQTRFTDDGDYYVAYISPYDSSNGKIYADGGSNPTQVTINQANTTLAYDDFTVTLTRQQ